MGGVSGDVERSGVTGRRHRWRYSSFELLLLGMFAALVVASHVALRLPVHMPGHQGIVWMALLVIARAAVPRPLAASTAGMLSGLMAALAGIGDHGPLITFLSYTAAGAGVDAVALLAGAPSGWLACALAGMVGNLAKLGVKTLLEIWIGIPTGFVVLGRLYPALTHIAFGLAGGYLGYLALRALRRAGYFDVLAEKR